MHRFYIPNFGAESALSIRDQDQIRQIRDVLKLRETEQVAIVPGDGSEVVCEIISIGKKDISLGMVEKRAPKKTAKRAVTLFCAVLKRDNFEWVAQKATECGVDMIVPITTDHTVKLGLNEERLQKIVVEAMEQSGRTTLPKLLPIITFDEAVKQADDFDAVIFCEQSDKMFSASDVTGAKKVAIFIGPEGGWSDAEKAYATEHMIVRSLGDTVLRAETAATVAVYLAVNF